jgi:hypothetical protein
VIIGTFLSKFSGGFRKPVNTGTLCCADYFMTALVVLGTISRGSVFRGAGIKISLNISGAAK